MRELSCRKNIILTIFLSLSTAACAFAQTSTVNRGYISVNEVPEVKKDTVVIDEDFPGLTYFEENRAKLDGNQRQAREYRDDGIEAQRVGKIDDAMAFYQKAIELDPAYPVACNDLGIIYESKGWTDRAEAAYLQAIKVDANYLSAYSNLAILYENKRDLMKAAEYWKKRVDLGLLSDPWTVRAERRLADIRLVLGEKNTGVKELETLAFINDVVNKKEILKEQELKAQSAKYRNVKRTKAEPGSNLERSQKMFLNAQTAYKKGSYEAALKESCNALLLDPTNEVISEFVEKLQAQLLSR